MPRTGIHCHTEVVVVVADGVMVPIGEIRRDAMDVILCVHRFGGGVHVGESEIRAQIR